MKKLYLILVSSLILCSIVSCKSEELTTNLSTNVNSAVTTLTEAVEIGNLDGLSKDFFSTITEEDIKQFSLEIEKQGFKFYKKAYNLLKDEVDLQKIIKDNFFK